MMEFTGLAPQAKLLRERIDSAISSVLDHGQFIMGPEVAELEDRLSSFCGAKHGIAVANGTDALQISLMASGISAGDAVFVPSFTYTATAEVILLLGATPIFVDVCADTFNVDMNSLQCGLDRAKSAGLRPKAIIAVDLFGLPADWARLNQFADDYDLFLIADAAQSFGAKSEGTRVGTKAPVTTTSFFPAKPLGCYGDGGAIFTDDTELAATMRSIRVHGQGDAKYETVRTGVNSRLDTLQAAILLQKLEVFETEIANRNALADFYSERLRDLVAIPKKPEGVISAWAQYTVLVPDRDGLQRRLKEEGVATAIYYPVPMHLQPAYAKFGEGPGSLPVSEKLSAEVLSLPMNPYWTEASAIAVCEAVERCLASSAPKHPSKVES